MRSRFHWHVWRARLINSAISVPRAISRCPIGRGSSASDQSTVACSSEVIHLLANQPHRLCLECADRTAKRIQNSDLELQPRRFGEIVEGSSHNKCCQPRSVCHSCCLPRGRGNPCSAGCLDYF